MTISGRAFAGHFDGVGVPELVRSETPADTGRGGGLAKVGAGGGGGGPVPTARRTVDDAEERPDGQRVGARAMAEVRPSPTRPCRPRAGARPCRDGHLLVAAVEGVEKAQLDAGLPTAERLIESVKVPADPA